ncbi:MAG TPA: hypothetical protein VKG25_02520 [Bryobacteraceae bacterium]|nr:hypothetical protein [Bryobacteraceae bacterium]
MIVVRHRGTLAGALIVLLSMAILAPLLEASPEASLPECCRAHGKHHCMMTETVNGQSAPALREKCCNFPRPIVRGVLTGSAPAHREATSIALVSHPACVKQTEARYRESFSRSRQKRGPPFLTVC